MIIDGRKLAGEIAGKLKNKNKLPRLTVGAVLVGRNPASTIFRKQKAKTAATLGINFKVFKFDQKITTGRLAKEVLKLNSSKAISGIIIQLPLPKRIKTDEILRAINPGKDVDALSPEPLVLAPTAGAVDYVFKKYKIDPRNKSVLIVGRGRLVGQPIFKWLSKTGGRVKIVDERQKNTLIKFTLGADIIISGAGVAGLIKGDMVKRGAILIDFGFSKVVRKNSPPLENKFLISKRKAQFSKGGGGDFDFKSCAKKAKLIPPVPGGMGPIMVAILFENLVKLNKKS